MFPGRTSITADHLLPPQLPDLGLIIRFTIHICDSSLDSHSQGACGLRFIAGGIPGGMGNSAYTYFRRLATKIQYYFHPAIAQIKSRSIIFENRAAKYSHISPSTLIIAA